MKDTEPELNLIYKIALWIGIPIILILLIRLYDKTID